MIFSTPHCCSSLTLIGAWQALMVHVISILIFGILIAGVNSPTLVTMYREMPYLWVISGERL